MARKPTTPTPPCGAMSKSRGEQCRNPGVGAGGRCRFHGGGSTGPKTAEGKEASRLANLRNMHAATPGSLRSRYYSEEEKAALASGDLQVGNLQPQIEALTVRLQRLLKAEAMSDEEALVVVERITREGGSLAGRETKYARRDFTGEVLRVMNTLERLVRTQAELDRARQMHLEDGPVTEICVRVIGGTADAIDGIAARQD